MATGRSRHSILLVGRLSPENPTPHFAAALRARGSLVSEIEETQCFPIAHSLAGRSIGRLLRARFEGELQLAIMSRARSVGAAVMLAAKGSHIWPSTIRVLREEGTRTVNWFPDFDFAHAGYDEARFADYDMVITAKRHQLAHLRAKFPRAAVEFVEHGYCPGLHRPILAPEPEFDAIYLGNGSLYKRGILVRIAERLPDRRFAVAGARWDDALPANVTRLGMQTGDFMAATLGRAHCAMAFHMGPHGPYGWEDLVSARSFEIPACGVPMLHVDNPEIRRWFEPGREFVPFTDLESLAAGIEYLRDDPARARAMAGAALARAVPHYGYDRRGAEIASIMEEAFPNPRQIHGRWLDD